MCVLKTYSRLSPFLDKKKKNSMSLLGPLCLHARVSLLICCFCFCLCVVCLLSCHCKTADIRFQAGLQLAVWQFAVGTLFPLQKSYPGLNNNNNNKTNKKKKKKKKERKKNKTTTNKQTGKYKILHTWRLTTTDVVDTHATSVYDVTDLVKKAPFMAMYSPV